jgi:Fe-S oxidoreductase/FAD/FMN-containing dehydrogenase
MGRQLTTAERATLKDMFGPRACFDPVERRLYGHDIAAIPGLVRPLAGNTIPAAVVQPESEAELVSLLKWAEENRVPLTPRGRASSGYGGAIPIRQGVVVDFYRLNKLVSVDPVAKTVTVEAGMVWEELDRKLAGHNLMLILYPTSYPSSTVGGWLAHGGAGIGSYEAGWFLQNVLKARVVSPSGNVREMSGSDLEMISDAMGTTGFVSQVTLRVQAKSALKVVALACREPEKFQQMLSKIAASGLPAWSATFINPQMARLKNKAPLPEQHGHPVGKHVPLPEAYILTLAIREKDYPAFLAAREAFFKTCAAEILSDEIAEHEWQQRFKLMVVKRLGPSLVPAEVVVPLSRLAEFLAQIEKQITQPIVKEGVLIRQGRDGQPEVVILGFIPSDQRKFAYNFVFGLVLSFMKIAEKLGGRPYATGMYFTGEADRILGRERVRRLKAFKQGIDPRGILNPGKVYAGGGVGRVLSIARPFEPLIRPFGNRVTVEIGERPSKPVKGIPADVAWFAYACSQCGYCVGECDQFYGRGWESQSPRGKWYWLREYLEGRVKWDQQQVDTFLVCTTCELCNKRCSADLPIEQSWMKLRGKLVQDDRQMTFPPFEMMAAALTKEGDIWAGYRRDRADWFPADLKARHGAGVKAKAVYFGGCTVSYVEHDIGMASVRLLDAAGVDFGYLGLKENCCGTPMLVAGKWEVFAETLRRNIEAVRTAGADTVITSCPACDMMWRHVYPVWAKKLGIEFNIRPLHYSEVLAEKITSGAFRFPPARPGAVAETVTWHDSCHAGRVSGIYDAPRQLIQAVPGAKLVEMAHNREEAHCCGSVLTLIKDPPVAAEIGKDRLDEALEAGAQKVLALCPCCEFQLRVSAEKKQLPVQVVDLARYAASALGYSFPDPNPEVQRQWAVFEAMIALMTPRGFADLMGTMFPELVAAMPFGMGGIMRAMGKIPGALDLMKPLFPVLFPRLLPMMMPKVMPVMLARVAERVPMPDYMREQMPELMPKVMDNLMPHMIGDVVPLVTGPLIRHLKGG